MFFLSKELHLGTAPRGKHLIKVIVLRSKSIALFVEGPDVGLDGLEGLLLSYLVEIDEVGVEAVPHRTNFH